MHIGPPQGYTPQHPELFDAAAQWPLGPRSDGPGKPPLEPLAPGIFRYRPLPREWTMRLAEEGRSLRDWLNHTGERPTPANSLSDYGFDLAPLGLAPLMQALLERSVEPWRERLFPELQLRPLDRVHGFLVEYGASADQDLSYHVDESELTLNLCLDGDFVGSELCFGGLRCLVHRQSPIEPSERLSVEHEPGVALLHAGALRHWVEPIQAGRRTNLILWATSSGVEPHTNLLENPACPNCATRLGG